MTISLSGCSKQADAPAGDGLKIAIVTSPSGVDDGSFNEDNYNGVLKFIETNPGATVGCEGTYRIQLHQFKQ